MKKTFLLLFDDLTDSVFCNRSHSKGTMGTDNFIVPTQIMYISQNKNSANVKVLRGCEMRLLKFIFIPRNLEVEVGENEKSSTKILISVKSLLYALRSSPPPRLRRVVHERAPLATPAPVNNFEIQGYI